MLVQHLKHAKDAGPLRAVQRVCLEPEAPNVGTPGQCVADDLTALIADATGKNSKLLKSSAMGNEA